MPDLTGRASSASSSSPYGLGGGWVAPRAKTTLPLPSKHTYARRVFDHFQVNILTRGESPSSSKAALLRGDRPPTSKGTLLRAESDYPVTSKLFYARRQLFQFRELQLTHVTWGVSAVGRSGGPRLVVAGWIVLNCKMGIRLE